MNMNDKVLIERSSGLILTVLFWLYNKCRKFFYFLVNEFREYLIRKDLAG